MTSKRENKPRMGGAAMRAARARRALLGVLARVTMSRKLIAIAVAVIAAISVTTALATPPRGLIATLFARGTLTTPVRADADGIVLRTDHTTDHAVQEIVQTPGASSGWHRHPGVVLLTVKSGTVATYDSHCRREILTAGQSDWQSGTEVDLVRNETAHDAVLIVTYIVPTGAPLRIDTPNPGCAVE
jgi:quercetin dioxygenase-like cupin family protein